MNKIPNCFYRISIKALILNEARDKFLICKEETDEWELPGGGLDWGATPQDDLQREIKEEMGLETTWIADNPSYFLTDIRRNDGTHISNVLYEAKLTSFDFIPSDECVEIRFVDKHDCETLDLFPNTAKFAQMFKPENH